MVVRTYPTVEEILSSRARREPLRPALNWHHRTLLLGRLAELVRSWADVLTGLVEPGGRVALVMSDTPRIIGSTLGIWRAGGAAVPLPPELSTEEIAARLRHSEVEAVIAHEEHVDNVREALRASGLNAIVVVSRAGRLIVEDGRRRGKRRKRAAAALETDVAFHAYSSSGALRAAVLTHANVVASAVRAGSARGDRIDDVTLATHRQCDVGALIGETLSRLISGGTVAILGKADAQKALAMIEEHRVTDLSLSADLLGSLLDEERLPRRAIRSVRRILLRGTGTSLTAKRRLADSLPDAELVQSYGKVETSDAICLAHHTQIFSKPDVLGTPHPGLMVEVVNAEGRPVRNGTTGEIVCRGSVVMRAYHRDPRATRASLRDGWFRTGDLGYIDGDGDLQWAGGRHA